MKVSYPIQIPTHCPFGFQNIPFGIFSTEESGGRKSQRRVGTAIGNFVVELDVLVKHGLFDNASLTKPLGNVFISPDLNAFAILPLADRRLVRQIIIQNLETETSPLFTTASLNEQAFLPTGGVQMHMPMNVTGYTDFFSSYIHAKNCEEFIGGAIPNAFYEYPMAYNGRVSSVVVSDTPVIRPRGFYTTSTSPHPVYQPSQKLDFEIEMGVLIGTPIPAGEYVTAANSAEHVFGYVLLNDWSSRDVQSYEMKPFGPLHSKSFLTSISPWVITLEALEGSMCGLSASHDRGELLDPILRCREKGHGLFDVELSAYLERNNEERVRIIDTKLADSHWDSFQMVAYQSSSGCGLRTGDLLGTGTISSPDHQNSAIGEGRVSTFGCLAEINHTKFRLPSVGGRPVTWLEDGDKFSFEAWFKTADGDRIGFGPVSGIVLPSSPL